MGHDVLAGGPAIAQARADRRVYLCGDRFYARAFQLHPSIQPRIGSTIDHDLGILAERRICRAFRTGRDADSVVAVPGPARTICQSTVRHSGPRALTVAQRRYPGWSASDPPGAALQY